LRLTLCFSTFSAPVYQKNLADVKLADIARTKAAATRPPTTDAPRYRDRALERRVIFGQPDVPAPEAPLGAKRKFAEGPPVPPPAPPPPPPAVHPGQDDSNVGNRLLKKMGWATGSGLGVSGEGRVAPM